MELHNQATAAGEIVAVIAQSVLIVNSLTLSATSVAQGTMASTCWSWEPGGRDRRPRWDHMSLLLGDLTESQLREMTDNATLAITTADGASAEMRPYYLIRRLRKKLPGAALAGRSGL